MIRNVTKLKFDWNKTKVSVSKIPLTMVQAVVSDAVMALGDLWAAEARRCELKTREGSRACGMLSNGSNFNHPQVVDD